MRPTVWLIIPPSVRHSANHVRLISGQPPHRRGMSDSAQGADNSNANNLTVVDNNEVERNARIAVLRAELALQEALASEANGSEDTDDANSTTEVEDNASQTVDGSYISEVVGRNPKLMVLFEANAVGVVDGGGKNFVAGHGVNAFITGAAQKDKTWWSKNRADNRFTACLPPTNATTGKRFDTPQASWTPKGDRWGNVLQEDGSYAPAVPAIAMLFDTIFGKGAGQRFDLSQFWTTQKPFVWAKTGKMTKPDDDGKQHEVWRRMPNPSSGFWTGVFGDYTMTDSDWVDFYAIAYDVGFEMTGEDGEKTHRVKRIPAKVPADVEARRAAVGRMANGLGLGAPVATSTGRRTKKTREVPAHHRLIRPPR